jgi:outer membrane immunogenic protein
MFCTARVLRLSICCLVLMLALTPRESAAGLAINRTVTGSNSANASSWLGGAHAGYNWQQGAVVFGFETDIQGTNLNSPMVGGLNYTPPGPPPAPDFASTQALIDWYGTFRGRLGTTIGSFLLYATAGVAYGNVALNSTFSAFGLTTHSQALQTKVGPVVGAGFEYIMMPNVMLTFGYQFVDLGKINLASSTSGTFGCCVSSALSQTATAHAQFQVAMVGLSWRFAPDGSPSPWAGGYAGGHVGGAWGNSASATYNGSTRFVGD